MDFLKKIALLLSLVCAAALVLSSCKVIDNTYRREPDTSTHSAFAPSTPSVNASPHSQTQLSARSPGYGRSLLSGDMLTAYDELAEAALDKESQVSIPLISATELSRVMTYIRRDFPELSYLADEYLYRNDSQNLRMAITLKYDETSRPIDSPKEEMEAAALQYLANISPELSDFDKAVIVHDRLVQNVAYDMDAPRASLLSGAIIDGRASCDGYAKAYQYLLQSLGIEALIVYGEAGGPHAWNIVRLDGDYYQADITWDDAILNDGTEFLSHEFLFLDDTRFSKTHTPSEDGANYPLPFCENLDQNYFVKTGTLLTSSDAQEAMDVLDTALDYAAANQSPAVQIRLEPPSLYFEVEANLLNTGTLDQFLRENAARRGAIATGRTVSEDGSVLTYLIKYID